MSFDIAQNCRLDTAVREIEPWASVSWAKISLIAIAVLELRSRKLHRVRIPVGGKFIDDRSAGVSQRQQLCDFVESLAGGVIARVADVPVRPAIIFPLCKVEVSVSPGDDQSENGKTQSVISLAAFLEQHCVNVAFEMIDCDQRLIESKCQCLGVADSYEKSSS